MYMYFILPDSWNHLLEFRIKLNFSCAWSYFKILWCRLNSWKHFGTVVVESRSGFLGHFQKGAAAAATMYMEMITDDCASPEYLSPQSSSSLTHCYMGNIASCSMQVFHVQYPWQVEGVGDKGKEAAEATSERRVPSASITFINIFAKGPVRISGLGNPVWMYL